MTLNELKEMGYGEYTLQIKEYNPLTKSYVYRPLEKTDITIEVGKGNIKLGKGRKRGE